MSLTPKPAAVLISDIHYNLNNLELADAALRQAIDKANQLKVPVIVAGDLHDTKALLRGECIKAIIETMKTSDTKPIVIPGNHCMINERSKDHALEFLRPYCEIIDEPTKDHDLGLWMIPYYSDRDQLAALLSTIPPGAALVMHQGVEGAKMGEYILDKSSLPKECFKDFRVISGHYHQAQDIKCGPPRKGVVGLFSYIGTPYTTSFAEANDGPKGFQVLMSDGTLQQVKTNLRKHVVYEVFAKDAGLRLAGAEQEDLVWVKLHGTRQELDLIDKNAIGMSLLGKSNYKLEKIYTDISPEVIQLDKMTGPEVLWSVIDESTPHAAYREYLKSLATELL